MSLTGELLIGSTCRIGSGGKLRAVDPSTGAELETTFSYATGADVEEACELARTAFDPYRALPLERRAAFLDAIAQALLDVGDALIARCMAETGLPRGRIEGERSRTVGQLRLFAGVVRDGGFLDARIDSAMPERQPLPRPDLRLRNIPLGPVAVFGASNFPLAFSVAGGDTSSALAAGCPVVVKAHSAHPGTSELVGRAVQSAALASGMPEGVFSMLHGKGVEVGQALATDPRIKAVGFTGSRGGGVALMKAAAGRREPIPVYAEMSSINPVILLPGALAERAEAIGKNFVASLTLGAGQFCTNPGLLIAVESDGLERFLASAGEAMASAEASVMLTPGIHQAFADGVSRLAAHPKVQTVARGLSAEGFRGTPALFSATSEDLLAHPELQEEVFGAAGVLVRCRDAAHAATIIEALEGQLTVAVHVGAGDTEALRSLLPILERKAGRVLVNGFGTGVEVAHAMVHGGPYPSTSDGRSTSVGSLAIRRFLRPVCYQDLPADLLPPELRDANPLGIWRLIDGAPAVP